jgi:Icc-related predicted phosphoesterase
VKILHTSDLHGTAHRLTPFLAELDFDVWVDSGDFFPTVCPHMPTVEARKQESYITVDMADVVSEWVRLLKGRPVIIVPGNHDYTDLALFLSRGGIYAHNLVTQGTKTIDSLRFSGFREISMIHGFWPGEAEDEELEPLVDAIGDQDPHVLVSHAPPHGILDRIYSGECVGIKAMTLNLEYSFPSLRAQLFGHVHEQGGLIHVHRNVQFSNAATKTRGNIIYV